MINWSREEFVKSFDKHNKSGAGYSHGEQAKLYKHLVNPEYEFTFKSSRRKHPISGIILTATIHKKNTITGEESIYEASRSYLHGSNEDPIKDIVITVLMEELLKETHTDEN